MYKLDWVSTTGAHLIATPFAVFGMPKVFAIALPIVLWTVLPIRLGDGTKLSCTGPGGGRRSEEDDLRLGSISGVTVEEPHL